MKPFQKNETNDNSSSNCRVINKLVRDRIPEIILDSGETPITKTIKGEELKKQLFEKLNEEYHELLADLDIKEVIDMIEVLLSIANFIGYNEKETIQVLHQKRNERGAFKNGIFLIEVMESKSKNYKD